MSLLTYILPTTGAKDRPLAWLHGEVKSPPLSARSRLQAGYLLRRLQRGEQLSMPESRPMPTIGPRCHELRIDEGVVTWMIFYRTDPRLRPTRSSMPVAAALLTTTGSKESSHG